VAGISQARRAPARAAAGHAKPVSRHWALREMSVYLPLATLASRLVLVTEHRAATERARIRVSPPSPISRTKKAPRHSPASSAVQAGGLVAVTSMRIAT
jgi:hypothetical protein